MAIPEACGLWIEQRIQEELEQQGETGTSLRAIGRQVAAEVEKYFETKVNPGTLAAKASRMNRVSNDTPAEAPTTTSDSEEIKEIKRPAKDGTMRGGPRPGAGRKMKSTDDQPHRKEDNEPLSNWREKSNGKEVGASESIKYEVAMKYARMAVMDLKCIEDDHPDREQAFNHVLDWVKNNR